MNELQTTILKQAIPPAIIKDAAAFSSLVIDKTELLGADYAEFILSLGSIDASMTVCKVMESDTKTNSTTLGGTPSLVDDAVTKPGSSDTNKLAVFGIDFRKSRQRYLQIQCTAGDGAAGTYASALLIARRPMDASSDAAKRGALFAQYA